MRPAVVDRDPGLTGLSACAGMIAAFLRTVSGVSGGNSGADGGEEQLEDDEASEEKALPVMGPDDVVDQRSGRTAG